MANEAKLPRSNHIQVPFVSQAIQTGGTQPPHERGTEKHMAVSSEPHRETHIVVEAFAHDARKPEDKQS